MAPRELDRSLVGGATHLVAAGAEGILFRVIVVS